MVKVIKLDYSNEDFKNTLESVTPIEDDKKVDLDPFPSTADLVIFASKAYSDKDDELRSGLPEGWKLLTTARNSTGYFGCLYFNPSQQQVVLAHRGTELLNTGAVGTDIKGVCLNLKTEYMFSAVILGDDIKRAILDLNKQDGVRFTLSITGHSLGGWISQVTAITLKHLKKWNDEFVRVSNIDDGIHAHTVAFDSPGVHHMAIKILWEYLRVDFNLYSIFRSLDISNVFIAVNYVNTTGYHVGTMYQILSTFNSVRTTDCTKPFFMHKIKFFTDFFENGDVKLLHVKGWPPGSGDLDWVKSVRLQWFSEAEIDLVNLLRMVKRNEIPQSEIEKFFDAKSFKPFPDFKIDRKENTVPLHSELISKQFFKNIKNASRWFSRELQAVMKEQKKLTTVPGFLLDMFSQECVKSIPDLLNCEDPLGLCDFTMNTAARVLYVQAADCSLEMARIYNILCNGDIDIDQCIFLNGESLLKLNTYLTKGLPLTNDRLNLFVINIGSTSERLVENILKNVFSKFQVYSEKKAVIVSHINSDLFNFVNSFEPELAIRCLPLSAQECLEFTFNDLKEQSKRELLSKEFINLGKQAMSLNALLGEDCQSSASIDDVLKPFLKDILMDESFTLNISNNLLKFDQLDVMFSKINREVKTASLTKLLLEETCSLFVSSDVRQLLEPQLQKVPGVAGRVLYISGSSEEDFRKACLENSSIHIAYWLAAADGRIFLKEVYNRSFYLPRRFHTQPLVDLKKLAQKKNDADLFIFAGVTDKATLMHYLNASPEVEELFSTNLKFSTTAENAEGIDRCVNTHTLQVVKEGGGYLLVLRDSQGALDSLLPCLSSRLLSEEHLCACEVIIMSDLPGMGKSTTLTSLSHHLVNSWVFRINLRDCPADITNLPEQMSVESVAQFLADAGSELAPVEKATLSLLRFCLQSQGSRQIHVLLDGFDEIRDEESVEKILKLCHFVNFKTAAKIIVTTRDSYKDVLENRLSTNATVFEEITKEIQLSFLVNFWHSHAELGQKEERLRQFAKHLYEAAHEKLGSHIVGLIGIPLHTRMLAEAFLLQAEEFIDNAEPLPDIIGINNVYSLYNKFISVKRDIYLNEKISLPSNMIGDILCETLTANLFVLAFEILDPEFKNKYLPMDKKYLTEMNRFGLTQFKRENHYDFIHRTFAEYFCSQLLVLWLRRDNFHYVHLPIEGWFLGNLLINKDFKVVRKFLDEHLAEVTLAEDCKQLLYDNMSKCWSKDAAAFCDENGKTALHVAVEEGNINIIDLLLDGLATEQIREPFESFLLARDYDGNTALKIGLKFLDDTYVFGSNLPTEKGIKQMLNITHLSYELKYKLILYTLFEGDLLSPKKISFTPLSKFLLTCALNEEDQEDIQKALNRIVVFRSEVLPNLPRLMISKKKLIEKFILNEQKDIAERKFLPLALIYKKTDINIKSRAGNFDLVNQYIKINRDVVNSRDTMRMTPLHHAAQGGHIKLVQFLLQQGARLNDRDSNGRTALFFAAEYGNLDTVKCILEHGADSNFLNEFGKSNLIYAREKNKMEVKHLISRKENVDRKDLKGMTPLHCALYGRKWAIAKYLLESEADPNVSDQNGITPLMCAVSVDLTTPQVCNSAQVKLNESDRERMEIIQTLISNDKDVNRSDLQGNTPLLYAIKGGHEEIVKYLISEVKVDIKCVDNKGKTPLHYAIEKGHEEIVKYLVPEVKVDIKRVDNKGKTPLHYAIEKGHEEIVKYLISKVKVEINCLDNEGKTPLIYALTKGNWCLAKYLLDSGADPNISDCNDKTPLMCAVENEIFTLTHSHHKILDNQTPSRLDIVKKLIFASKDITMDINKSDSLGKTPLHYAIKKIKFSRLPSSTKIDLGLEVAEHLLKVGADPNILDHDYKTPLDYIEDEDILNHLKSIKTPSGDPIT